MNKVMVFVCSALLILSTLGSANATLYEYYSGFQTIYEGQTHAFFFDLVSDNVGTGTSSSLALNSDVAVGEDALPLESAYVNINLFSQDWAWENAYITLTAMTSDSYYTIYDGWFNALEFFWIDKTIANFSFDITGGFFLENPSGTIDIVASITSCCNFNDFAITEVGIGAEVGTSASTLPVPEPATMLLFGTGLIGLAGLSRKKILK